MTEQRKYTSSEGAVISHQVKSTFQEPRCTKFLLSTTVVILFFSAIVKMADDEWTRMEKKQFEDL